MGMEELIDGLLDSKDLLELRDGLESIDACLDERETSPSALCKALSHALRERLALLGVDGAPLRRTEGKPRYRLYPAYESMPYFLSSNGFMSGKAGETRRLIKSMVEDISQMISPAAGNVLTIEKEELILGIVDEKFAFWETVRMKEPLIVLNINNIHKALHSACVTNEKATALIIYLFAVNDEAVPTEYVFLHELGHILQVVLTGSAQVVPAEFMDMHFSLPGASLLDQQSETAANYFADAFAISAMRGTELAGCDPIGFPDNLTETFERFYVDLFRKYRR